MTSSTPWVGTSSTRSSRYLQALTLLVLIVATAACSSGGQGDEPVRDPDGNVDVNVIPSRPAIGDRFTAHYSNRAGVGRSRQWIVSELVEGESVPTFIVHAGSDSAQPTFETVDQATGDSESIALTSDEDLLIVPPLESGAGRFCNRGTELCFELEPTK